MSDFDKVKYSRQIADVFERHGYSVRANGFLKLLRSYVDGTIKVPEVKKAEDKKPIPALAPEPPKVQKKESRFAMIIYWIILAKLISYDNVLMYDKVGRFYDKNGVLGFGDENNVADKIAESQNIIIKTDDESVENEFIFKIDETEISIADKSGATIFLFSSKNYFKSSEPAIKGGE